MQGRAVQQATVGATLLALFLSDVVTAAAAKDDMLDRPMHVLLAVLFGLFCAEMVVLVAVQRG